MINVPKQFQPQINIVYPPNNFCEYERWFFENYEGDVSDREYLPIFWTAYYVNNNYGRDIYALNQLQSFIDKLDKSKKYFSVIQYDDSILNDVSGIDLYQFNMSKPYDCPIGLIGMPHPYMFNGEKKYLASFVGNITHPIRNHAKLLQGKDGYYISFDKHSPEDYCRIISESYFTLCYRGYGYNSFRITESLQYNSIPVYISDLFVEAFNIPFETYGLKFTESLLDKLDMVLNSFKGSRMFQTKQIYQEAYTYEGTKNKILNHLKNGVD